METDSAGQDGDNLRIGRQSGCKENYRNEHEQRAEHVHEVWNEIHVVIEDNRMKRSLLGNEIIDFLTDIEDYDDSDYQQKRDKESRHELLDYIDIQFFGKHNMLESCHYLLNSHILPGLEITCDDMLAGLCHEIQIECEIMFACNHCRKHLSGHEKMPQICLRVCPVDK